MKEQQKKSKKNSPSGKSYIEPEGKRTRRESFVKNGPISSGRRSESQGSHSIPPAVEDTSRGKSAMQPRGAAKALVELDRDLMKLLVRRAVLVSRIRQGKDHAASPQAIMDEKMVRLAWEASAVDFSKDPLFTRQLFSLLQDIKMLSKGEAATQTGYSLFPSRKPVEIAIIGPISTHAAMAKIIFSVVRNRPLSLEPVIFTEEFLDTLKTLAQAGAGVTWEVTGNSIGKVKVSALAEGLSLSGKTVYLGNSVFALYLLALFAAKNVGVVRFTGGAVLKKMDLLGLRHLLPTFGARLSHAMPRSSGLPASVESSGVVPEQVVVPMEAPAELIAALHVAVCFWEKSPVLDVSQVPAEILADTHSFLSGLLPPGCLNDDAVSRPLFLADPESSLFSAPLSMDVSLAAYLLALPAVVGGKVCLRGNCNAANREAAGVASLLAFAGVTFQNENDQITSKGGGAVVALPLDFDMSERLLPLYCVLFAAQHSRQGKGSPVLLPHPAKNHLTAQDFLFRLGVCEEKTEDFQEGTALSSVVPALQTPWIAPDAYWGMAWALAAFLRPGLRLANPDIVTRDLPFFWAVYNGLPNPTDPILPAKNKHVEQAGKETRRRFIVS